ncbi:MAG: EI24 domain-containing protein [Patescibacteria group bacterium]
MLWYFTAPFRALSPLVRERGLRRVAIIPWVLSLVLIGFSLRFGIGEIMQLVHDVVKLSGVWAIVAATILTIMLVVTLAYLFIVLLVIVSGPFNELLSEQTEEFLRPTTGPTLTSEERRNRRIRGGRVRLLLRVYAYAIRTEIVRLALFGFVSLLLFLGSWWSGGLVFLVLNGVVSLFFLVFEFLDYSMARHDFSFRQKIDFIRRNALPCAVYGLGLMVFLLIPGLNLCFIPAAVISGTEVFLRHAPR